MIFFADACEYWSQHRQPVLDLVMEYRRKSNVFAHISATNVNPYTHISLALFVSKY